MSTFFSLSCSWHSLIWCMMEVRELRLEIRLLRLPLLDVHFLLAQLLLALLDLVHDGGLLEAALVRLGEQRLVLLLELVEHQKLLVEDEELDLRVLQVRLELRLLAAQALDRVIEGLDNLAKLLLPLLLLEPEALAHLRAHHAREGNLGDFAGLPALLERERLGLQEEHLRAALGRGGDVQRRRECRDARRRLRSLLL